MQTTVDFLISFSKVRVLLCVCLSMNVMCDVLTPPLPSSFALGRVSVQIVAEFHVIESNCMCALFLDVTLMCVWVCVFASAESCGVRVGGYDSSVVSAHVHTKVEGGGGLSLLQHLSLIMDVTRTVSDKMPPIISELWIHLNTLSHGDSYCNERRRSG